MKTKMPLWRACIFTGTEICYTEPTVRITAANQEAIRCIKYVAGETLQNIQTKEEEPKKGHV